MSTVTMLNNHHLKFRVICALLAAFTFPKVLYAQDPDTIVDDIAKKVDLCVHNNRYSLNDVKDCGALAEQALETYQKDFQLTWQFASMIRRKLGNALSLKFYNRALKEKMTPERCIDDGVDAAVKAGLALPPKNNQQSVNNAIEIVFKLCWDEFKEEIVVVTKGNTSSFWMENVCTGAKTINQAALFSNCS